MPYIDETSKEGQTVERLIRFMKSVENPEWMIDLVKDMKDKVDQYESMAIDIINKLEETRNPIYRADGSLMGANGSIKINDAIGIVREVCGLNVKKILAKQIIKNFKDYLFLNDIELENGGDFTIVQDIVSGLIEKYDLENKPAKDTAIKETIEDEIMASLCDVLIKGGYADPLTAVGIVTLRSNINNAFATYDMF